MKRFRIPPVILPKPLMRWGLNPGRLGASPTRYLETNTESLILLIHSKDQRFYCQAASLFLFMVKVFPF